MNAVVLCVGRLKEPWQRAGVEEYLKPVSYTHLLADGTPLTVVERETCEHVHSWRIALPEGHKHEIDTVICVEVAEAEIRFEPLGK